MSREKWIWGAMIIALAITPCMFGQSLAGSLDAAAIELDEDCIKPATGDKCHAQIEKWRAKTKTERVACRNQHKNDTKKRRQCIREINGELASEVANCRMTNALNSTQLASCSAEVQSSYKGSIRGGLKAN